MMISNYKLVTGYLDDLEQFLTDEAVQLPELRRLNRSRLADMNEICGLKTKTIQNCFTYYVLFPNVNNVVENIRPSSDQFLIRPKIRQDDIENKAIG